MFPHRKSSSRCVIICLMEVCGRRCSGVGARISRSKLNKSHQNASERLLFVDWTMLDTSVAKMVLNRFLLFPERNRNQVDRKCGGCWM